MADKKVDDKKQTVSPTWGVPSEAWAERGGSVGPPSEDKPKKKK